MQKPRVGILHYSAPPVVGGVESVLSAHAKMFCQKGYLLIVIAGRGKKAALPDEAEFVHIPEIDSQHPAIIQASVALESGKVPENFQSLVQKIFEALVPVTANLDTLLVHNVFTKHFNLPLTAALFRLLEDESTPQIIAWCHDFTWTSHNSRHKVHSGYPWDLLRTYRPDMTYVVVSKRRQQTLANLLHCPAEEIHVVYNGVDPGEALSLSAEGEKLINRLGMLDSDINLFMPVRITQAKNIEYAMQVTAALKRMRRRPKLVISGPPDPHDDQSMIYYHSLLEMRQQLDVEQEARFVVESGPNKYEGFLIEMRVVADLLRVSDVVFMPSHREGFGMPVLEAGLVGIPVISSDIPAAREIGGEDVTIFDTQTSPADIARLIIKITGEESISRMRRKVRLGYTWEAIFENSIQPLVDN